MKISTILARVIPLLFLTSAGGLLAQFSPGPNPITGTVGAQTLSSGTGTINGGGAISIASGATVPLVMTGTSTLINNGTIQTLGTGRAIDSNSGIANLTVTNTGLISSVSADAFRVNTNSAVSLTNSGTIQVTAGGQAIDWAAITSASNTLNNQGAGVISTVGEDAVRPGTNGVVINAGSITATPTGGASPTGSDGIDLRTFTGIQVTNTGTISGRHGIATDGANVGPSTLVVNNNAGTISAVNGSGINVDGVNTGVTANVTNALGATIQGGVLAVATNGDGDGVDVDGVLTLNNSGNIFGYGAKGVGSDTLPNGAQAVSIGGGSITNTATGQIIGSTLVADAPNGDVTRAGEGILADNSSGGNAIAATTVANSGLIQGKSGAAIRMVGTFANSVTNNAGGTIRGAGSGAAVQTGNGNDTIDNSGAVVGDNGQAIDMQGGNNTLNILGGSAAVTGSINGGTGGTNAMSIDPGTGNSFSYAGAISNFSSVAFKSGTATLSGSSSYTGGTSIDGGKLDLATAGMITSSVVVKAGASLVHSGTIGGSGTGVTVQGGGSYFATDFGTTGLAGFSGTGQSLDLQSGSTTSLDIGGTVRGTGYDYIAGLAGFALPTSGLAAHFALNYLASYTPAAGDTFDIFDWDTTAPLPGSLFDFSPAPAGFIWDTNNFVNTGSISLAVPEPGRAFLLMIGVGGLIWRRRRSRASN